MLNMYKIIRTGKAINWVLISVLMVFGLYVISSTFIMKITLPQPNRVALYGVAVTCMFVAIMKEFFLKTIWIRIALTIAVFTGLVASLYFLWTYPILEFLE
jgi:hypothetical protein